MLQKEGIDVASGKPPSMVQMMKLAANKEFREAGARVGSELKKAGVEINSQEIMQELSNLRKSKPDSG